MHLGLAHPLPGAAPPFSSAAGPPGRRLFLAVLVTLMAQLVSRSPMLEAILVRVDLDLLAAFATGALFGWAGVLGVAGSLGIVQLATDTAPITGWPGLDLALGAALGFVAFRFFAGTGRGLPSLRSYLVVMAAALAASVAVPVLEGLTAALSPSVGPRVLSSFLTLVLFLPPVLLAADRWLRPWLVPIPGERVLRAHTRRWRFGPPGVGRGVPGWVLGSQLLAITLLLIPVAAELPTQSHWVALLYLLPVLQSAFTGGERGILVASLAGALLIAVQSALGGRSLPAPGELIAYSHALLLSFLAAVVGLQEGRLEGLRARLAGALEHRRWSEEAVVRALSAALEAKDPHTEQHLRRVALQVDEVARRLGLSGRALEVVRYGATLHDLGKLGIPDSVLGKPAALSPEERRLMCRHPEIGADILRELDVLEDVVPLVLQHQERYDGRGYPQGLAGREISLGARIIAVVDAFDAMVSDRPYRRALAVEEAVQELRREAGRQFDPLVVHTFLEVLEEDAGAQETPNEGKVAVS